MKFNRTPIIKLPNGDTLTVYPYHITTKGLEKNILCLDDEDYEALVKILCVVVLRHNAILVAYAVMSNHIHMIVLCADSAVPGQIACDLKKMYGMYYCNKYEGDTAIFRRVGAGSIMLDSDWYLRNAIAYTLRNPVDNGAKILDYRWSSVRAMFKNHQSPEGAMSPSDNAGLYVRRLSRREKENLFHTHDDLSKTDWMMNARKELEPSSTCFVEYAEAAFAFDQTFYMKMLGTVNMAEMESRLSDASLIFATDSEMSRYANDTSRRFYDMDLNELPLEKRYRMVPYLYRSRRTSVQQLSRVLGVDKEKVSMAVRSG